MLKSALNSCLRLKTQRQDEECRHQQTRTYSLETNCCAIFKDLPQKIWRDQTQHACLSIEIISNLDQSLSLNCTLIYNFLVSRKLIRYMFTP